MISLSESEITNNQNSAGSDTHTYEPGTELGRPREEDCQEFKTPQIKQLKGSLGFSMRPCLQSQTTT